jgi:hypothetical protein
MDALILKALRKRYVSLTIPDVEFSESLCRTVSDNENLVMILANCMTKKQILVVKSPSRLPASFVSICVLDAILDAARFAQDALAKTRNETQGQLVANVLSGHSVSDLGVLLEELDVIFTQELLVANLIGSHETKRKQLIETLQAEEAMGLLH